MRKTWKERARRSRRLCGELMDPFLKGEKLAEGKEGRKIRCSGGR